MGRRLLVQLARQIPGQKRRERRVEFFRPDLVKALAAFNIRREPNFRAAAQSRLAQVGPRILLSLARIARKNLAQKSHPFARLPLRLAPVQPVDAESGGAARQQRGVFRRGGDRQVLLGEGEGAEAPRKTPPQGAARRIETRFVAAFDLIGEQGLETGFVQFGGGEDAAGAGAPGDFGHGQQSGPRQRRMSLDAGGAAIGHQKFARLAAPAGDAVGVGQRDQGAGRKRERGGLLPQLPCGSAQLPRKTLRQPARVFSARRKIPLESVEPVAEIGRIAAEAALGDDNREVAGLFAGAEEFGQQDHAGEARRQRQAAHGFSARRDRA